MQLTPIDLKKQEFRRTLRGYDPVQVRAFLDEVAETWETWIRAQEETRKRIGELSDTIENYRRMERTLNETLIAAQRIAEESRETALKEADIARKEAEMEGRRAIERAEAEARQLVEQTRELRIERDHLFTKLRNLMEEELLRLHALRDAHADVPTRRGFEASLSPPALANRAVTAPPAGVRDRLERPVGLEAGIGQRGKPAPAWQGASPGDGR